jgi:hypothetical protein
MIILCLGRVHISSDCIFGGCVPLDRFGHHDLPMKQNGFVSPSTENQSCNSTSHPGQFTSSPAATTQDFQEPASQNLWVPAGLCESENSRNSGCSFSAQPSPGGYGCHQCIGSEPRLSQGSLRREYGILVSLRSCQDIHRTDSQYHVTWSVAQVPNFPTHKQGEIGNGPMIACHCGFLV